MALGHFTQLALWIFVFLFVLPKYQRSPAVFPSLATHHTCSSFPISSHHHANCSHYTKNCVVLGFSSARPLSWLIYYVSAHFLSFSASLDFSTSGFVGFSPLQHFLFYLPASCTWVHLLTRQWCWSIQKGGRRTMRGNKRDTQAPIAQFAHPHLFSLRISPFHQTMEVMTDITREIDVTGI